MEHLQGCSLILHGGDIGGQEILDELEKTAPSRMYLTHPGIDVDGILNRLHDAG